MLLFLDFDSVLRSPSSPSLTFDSKCLALFERTVLEIPRGRARERWIGIDDDPLAYPPTCRVVLTDPAVGFDEAASNKLGELTVAGN